MCESHDFFVVLFGVDSSINQTTTFFGSGEHAGLKISCFCFLRLYIYINALVWVTIIVPLFFFFCFLLFLHNFFFNSLFNSLFFPFLLPKNYILFVRKMVVCGDDHMCMFMYICGLCGGVVWCSDRAIF